MVTADQVNATTVNSTFPSFVTTAKIQTVTNTKMLRAASGQALAAAVTSPTATASPIISANATAATTAALMARAEQPAKFHFNTSTLVSAYNSSGSVSVSTASLPAVNRQLAP